jgi:peptidoglycan/LPS O-acetylase OafA/YrhL
MQDLRAITGLRFVAAFYIFIFHLEFIVRMDYLPAPLLTLVREGALSVNLFFILSGFILTYSHLRDFKMAQLPSASYYGKFMFKRFARIYPAYFAGLLLYLAASIAYQDYTAPFKELLVLNVLGLEAYVPPLSMLWYGSGGWSVSVEIFFYLLFPFALPLLLRITSKTGLLLILAILTVLTSVPGLLYNFAPEIMTQKLSYSFPVSRFPEFLSGIVVALLVFRHNWQVPEWVALGLLLFSALYLAKFSYWFEGHTAHSMVVGPAIMATIATVSQLDKTRFLTWLGSKPMEYLGRVSFSFYLVHISMKYVLGMVIAQHLEYQNRPLIVVAFFVLNLLVSMAVYELVEKRAHRWLLQRFLGKKPAVAVA